MDTQFNFEKLDNMNNAEKLKRNMIVISTFVLLYEGFRYTFTKRVKEKLCTWNGLDENNNNKYEETDEYKKIIKGYNEKNPILPIMLWFKEQKAITQSDYGTFLKIRDKRNQYVHEMEQQLYDGISKSDIKILKELASLYTKICDWWAKAYDHGVRIVPIAEIMVANLSSDDDLKDLFSE